MSATPSPNPQLDEIPAVELLKTRSQLAWNWFEFHARQRMTMFNNFLIITGILVNGYAVATKESLHSMAAIVSLFGSIQAVCFCVIDVRSRHLIRYGEDVLEKLERDSLFPDSFSSPEIQHGQVLGLLRCDQDLREGKHFIPRRLLKMKYWMRSMYVLVCLGFLFAAVTAGLRAW
jgi:hypothetical protein